MKIEFVIKDLDRNKYITDIYSDLWDLGANIVDAERFSSYEDCSKEVERLLELDQYGIFNIEKIFTK